MIISSSYRQNVSGGLLEISVISDTDGFGKLEDIWSELFRESACNNLFLEHKWMYTWWECRNDPLNLNIYLIKFNQKVVGLAPLMRKRQPLGRIYYYDLFLLTAFEDPFSERAVSGSLDFLWLAEYDHLKTVFARYLLEKTRGWCYLRLNPVPELSTTLTAFRQAGEELGFEIRTPWVLQNAVLNIGSSWEDYLTGRSANLRKNLRRFLRYLEEKYRVEFTEYRSVDEVEQGIAETLAVEEVSWKGERGFSINHSSLNRFYLKIIRAYAREQRVHLWLLKLDGKPVAYDLHIDCKGYTKNLKGSFVQDFAEYSPGTLLTGQAIQALFKDKIEQVDLLWGSLHYKQKWTNALEVQHGIYCRRRGWYPGLVRKVYVSKFLRNLLGVRRPASADAGTSAANPPEQGTAE